MIRCFGIIVMSLFFIQLAFAVDCKMFMSGKDSVTILDEKKCQVDVDNSINKIGEVDMCLAKMKTANGINIVRIVLETWPTDRIDSKQLFIVEKQLKDISNEQGKLFFTQDYFNTGNLKKTRYNIQMTSDFNLMNFKVAVGLFSLKPLYDVNFECR